LSLLKLSLASPGSSPGLVFEAVSNRTYSVQFTEQLGASNWIKLMDVVATTNNLFITNTCDTAGAAARFYRVVVPRQP